MLTRTYRILRRSLQALTGSLHGAYTRLEDPYTVLTSAYRIFTRRLHALTGSLHGVYTHLHALTGSLQGAYTHLHALTGSLQGAYTRLPDPYTCLRAVQPTYSRHLRKRRVGAVGCLARLNDARLNDLGSRIVLMRRARSAPALGVWGRSPQAPEALT